MRRAGFGANNGRCVQVNLIDQGPGLAPVTAITAAAVVQSEMTNPAAAYFTALRRKVVRACEPGSASQAPNSRILWR
ncbi:MAG: hypothetical protein JWN41_1816 [Thermoleophilia bacterium]|nr:hypothetical protein [Thermoleophilia bacterium]